MTTKREIKVTKREMFELIKECALSGKIDLSDIDQTNFVEEVDFDTIVDFCENEIDNLDKKKAKAQERAAKNAAAGDELAEAVKAALTDELTSIADIAAKVDHADATHHKVQYRLGKLASNGEIAKGEIVETDGAGKKRKIVGYMLLAD
jgi:hypothetical protein